MTDEQRITVRAAAVQHIVFLMPGNKFNETRGKANP
jgi:hypothetical protein